MAHDPPLCEDCVERMVAVGISAAVISAKPPEVCTFVLFQCPECRRYEVV